MKKFLVILLILAISSPAFAAANQYRREFKDQATIGQIVEEISSAVQIRCDYGARTDSQPEYCGYAAAGIATATNSWFIYKFTYDGNGQMTVRQSSYDVWDDRATATYA